MQTEYRCLISNFQIGEFCSWVSLLRWYFVSPNLPGCHLPKYKLFILPGLKLLSLLSSLFLCFCFCICFYPLWKPQFYKQGLAIEIG